MTATQEIVTIQAGNYANFVGTHWWNMQESSFCYASESSTALDINHDVLFREGENYRKEVTYTPRLILIDLKDDMKSIRRECPLYRYPREESNNPLWEGPVDVIKEASVHKNPFLEEFEKISGSSSNCNNLQTSGGKQVFDEAWDFNSSSTLWSDFLKTNLHPRSFCLFNEFVSSKDKSPLDIYSSGDEMYRESGKEIIQDAIRRMTEECDYLQGFHLIFDSHNGFSGISSHILQYLDDEYKRQPSLCFPTYQGSKAVPVQDIKEQMHRLYAVLMSLDVMNSCCSLFSPLCLSSDVIKLNGPFRKFPYLQYNEALPYHTSSILAAAIETLSSQYRLKSVKFSMSDVTSAMSMYSRKLVCSSMCLPFPLNNDAYLSAMVEKDVPEYFMTSLSPFYNPDSEKTLYQTAVLRGVPKIKFQRLFHSLKPEEVFGQYLDKYSSSSSTCATVFYEMCSVVPPFPRIFNNLVGMNGFLNLDLPHNEKGVKSVPVAATFSSSDSVSQFIEDLLSQANKLSFKDYVKCAETTFEKDDFREVMQNLMSLQDNYQNY